MRCALHTAVLCTLLWSAHCCADLSLTYQSALLSILLKQHFTFMSALTPNTFRVAGSQGKKISHHLIPERYTPFESCRDRTRAASIANSCTNHNSMASLTRCYKLKWFKQPMSLVFMRPLLLIFFLAWLPLSVEASEVIQMIIGNIF